MQKFNYVEPKSLEEACSLLDDMKMEARALAGGTALIYQIKRRLISPTHLVNLKSLKELDYIEFDPRKGLRIGALTRLRTIERSPLIMEKYPSLAHCVSLMGSVQMRNVATIGGNLCHAEPAADLPPLLIALGATVRFKGAYRQRTVSLESFYSDFYETIMRRDEILCEIRVPRIPGDTGVAYLKYNPRSAMDMGIVGAAAAVRLEEGGGVFRDVRIAVGGVAPTVVRARKAEELLKGKRRTAGLMEKAARAVSAAADPISDFRASAEYRREMAAVYAGRAVAQAAVSAGSGR